VVSEIVSHYRIIEKLNESRVGELYLAEDLRLGRVVALQFLPASYSYDANRKARLLAETGAAAALRSPHTATIYDISEHEGTAFIVREYVSGELLSDRLKRGPIEARDAIDAAAQVADALDEAHGQNVLHGDLKSSSIIITARGLVKVLDFGLSELTGRRLSAEDQDKTARLGQDTAIDALSGDVSFMSPEQSMGRPVDHRSDIFSLGVVLFEMVAGRLPFQGEGPIEVIQNIIHQPTPRTGRVNSSSPLEIERIIRKCLEKDPARRYQSARELLIDLKNLKRDTDSGGAPLEGGRSTTRVRAARARRPRSRRAVTSLAVLPLANTSPDPDTEYLSDGITESLINNLSQLPRLRVMARSTVFRYKGKEADALEVGRALAVEAVVAGRVTLRGDRLIIHAEMVDVTDGARLWGQHFNRSLSDIFAIEQEIASEITESLRLKLTGEEKKRLSRRHTENTGAYQLYLKGRYFWNRRTEEGLQKGIEHFNLAIEADPLYALAYAGLADCYNMMCWWNIARPKEALPRARAAAERALELDDSLAEVHASMGGISETAWDWASAERSYRRALELNPNYASAHQWYAEFLAHVGNFDRALEEMKMAELLDPLSSIINTEVGWILYLAGHYDRAIEQCRAAVEMDPEFSAAHWRLAEAYIQKAMYEEAISEMERALELSGGSTYMVARLGYAYAVAGKKYEALKVLGDLSEVPRDRYVAPDSVAIIYAGLGERELAFAWLEKAFDERSSWLAFLKVEPAYDRLRDDPRFTDLLGRVGLP
jgi:serine/threonine-protein kinase